MKLVAAVVVVGIAVLVVVGIVALAGVGTVVDYIVAPFVEVHK